MFQEGWIEPGDIHRAVRVTNRGVEELHTRFNLDINWSR
jgi:hypothetical protein